MQLPWRYGEAVATVKGGSHRRRPLRPLVLGGLLGPAIFVADWAVLGTTRRGYSPVNEAISRLAQMGVSSRPAMTAGFICYGAGLIAYGAALRESVSGSAWLWVAATGVLTLGVAAAPLGTPTSGAFHAAFASAGYATLSGAVVVLLPTGLVLGHRCSLPGALLGGATTAALLVVSVTVGPGHGLIQRLGLTLGDTIIGLSALQLLSRRGRRGPETVERRIET